MRIILIAGLFLALSPAVVSAHDAHSHGGHVRGATVEGGAPGKAGEVTRDVTIVATDSEFTPKAVAVKAGETIRFIVRNGGKLVHELTIGTKDTQAEHQSEMLGFAVSGAIEADRIDRAKLGAHDHGNNVILEPGQTGAIIWTFAKAANLEFGCNIPGHYEAGMKGDFRFD